MTGFLYPFLDAEERDQDSLLHRSRRVRTGEGDGERGAAGRHAGRVRRSGRHGGRGDGPPVHRGWAPVRLRQRRQLHRFARPSRACSRTRRCTTPLPAWSLTADQAILTALGNDVGFELVFARQLIARGGRDDIAVAMSTSGSSKDLTAAFREARKQGMYTVGFAGYDGGEFATSADVDVCFVVGSQSVHRIQEAQALAGIRAVGRRTRREMEDQCAATT